MGDSELQWRSQERNIELTFTKPQHHGDVHKNETSIKPALATLLFPRGESPSRSPHRSSLPPVSAAEFQHGTQP
jgi:hypothetical protein